MGVKLPLSFQFESHFSTFMQVIRTKDVYNYGFISFVFDLWCELKNEK